MFDQRTRNLNTQGMRVLLDFLLCIYTDIKKAVQS